MQDHNSKIKKVDVFEGMKFHTYLQTGPTFHIQHPYHSKSKGENNLQRIVQGCRKLPRGNHLIFLTLFRIFLKTNKLFVQLQQNVFFCLHDFLNMSPCCFQKCIYMPREILQLGVITIFVILGLFRHFETVTNIRTWIRSHIYWRML